MADPVILFIKPGAISDEDKLTLLAAGVIVIGVDDPQSVKLTRATAELSGSQMLSAAVAALKAVDSEHTSSRPAAKALGHAIIATLANAKKD